MQTQLHDVTVYYEDTDHSGLVYHANYLKYCERAREHVLGRDELVRLLREEGIGFVVYRADLTYRRGAVFGDILEIRSTVDKASDYRLGFQQNTHRKNDCELLVEAKIDLVCVDRDNQLVPLPAVVMSRLAAESD